MHAITEVHPNGLLRERVCSTISSFHIFTKPGVQGKGDIGDLLLSGPRNQFDVMMSSVCGPIIALRFRTLARALISLIHPSLPL